MFSRGLLRTSSRASVALKRAFSSNSGSKGLEFGALGVSLAAAASAYAMLQEDSPFSRKPAQAAFFDFGGAKITDLEKRVSNLEVSAASSLNQALLFIKPHAARSEVSFYNDHILGRVDSWFFLTGRHRLGQVQVCRKWHFCYRRRYDGGEDYRREALH